MKAITNEERKKLIDDIMMQHEMGNETLGTSIRRLRLEVTGFDQNTFAAMCNMSTKALYQIEKDKGNPSVSTIAAILSKFGLRLGLTTAVKTAHTASFGQDKPGDKTPARGTNPQRKYAGQLSRAATLRTATKTQISEGEKDSTE
ncbi:helix-turn-helix domain-containing protein [Pseudomonas benzenivorans]|uniref:Helix-turn-helix transcriptional regulator n=1 Tax=Pseudomonas benzenivorans TaxID=556533 RepID=A0ABY5H777_9PSED|nr:helix-turn-helix transcriptional regulator [Pseudomonas benzenivorans]UTW08172.1 helix-turn-helix transcriptional regulator [Pseudomonas benzenivorans]